jgi:hypothetical protein
MAVLKQKIDNERQELEFELDYQATLCVADRFEMMFERSRLISEQLEKYGHRKAFEIIKRK